MDGWMDGAGGQTRAICSFFSEAIKSHQYEQAQLLASLSLRQQGGREEGKREPGLGSLSLCALPLVVRAAALLRDARRRRRRRYFAFLLLEGVFHSP